MPPATDFEAPLGAVLGAFGDAYTYTPPGSGSTALPAAMGVFDRHGTAMRLDGEGAPVAARQVRLGVRLADFPDAAPPLEGGRVLVAGALYTVAEVRPDSAGGAVLILSGRPLGQGSLP